MVVNAYLAVIVVLIVKWVSMFAPMLRKVKILYVPRVLVVAFVQLYVREEYLNSRILVMKIDSNRTALSNNT